MKNKNIVNIFFSFLLILLGISLLLNYRFFRENKALKDSLPYLLDGERITYFDLIDINNKKITAAELNDGKL